mgnify:CR=1 FL=1
MVQQRFALLWGRGACGVYNCKSKKKSKKHSKWHRNSYEQYGGELVVEYGKLYKVFYGMRSDTAMNKHHGGVANYRSSEGKTVKIKCKGPVTNTVQNILGGVF